MNLKPHEKRRIDVLTPKVGTIFTGDNGTKRETISTPKAETGRTAEQNVMRETPGPKYYVKKRPIHMETVTAFTLF